MNKWLTAIAALLCSITVNAATEFTVDGIKYTVASADGTCSVSDYDESFGAEVVIPSSVDYRNRTFSVTSIGGYAFSDCSSLTSITIAEGVTSIGNYAFYGCYKLTAINIPESVRSIGDRAFRDCSSLTSITIPEGVTSIGSYAFYGCSGELTVNCNIPSASSYENGAFYKSKFTKVTIGEGVTSIGNYAFYGCYKLTAINIPESVRSIGDRAFRDCSSLTSISCLATTPPTIYMDTFDSDAYNFADLFVPQGTKDAYQAATGWKNFYFINDTLPSGIDNITVGQSPKIYDLNGRELQAPQQGINIVGGRKVLVK